MKIIKRPAKYLGWRIYHGKRFDSWRCPNKNCGQGVSEDYVCCPYCGQKLKFKKPPEGKSKYIIIKIK